MQMTVSPIILVAIVAGILALVAIGIAFRMRTAAKHSPIGIAVAILPALLMFGLFYSLSIHMHHVLGGWPSSIGEHGFPSSLVTHAHIARDYFTLIFLLSIFVWPVAFLLCLFIQRWRVCVYYLGVYAL